MAAVAAVGEPVALGAMHQTLGTQAAVAAVGKTQVGQIGVASGSREDWSGEGAFGRVAMQASSAAAVAVAKSVRGGLCIRHVTLAIGFSPHGTSNLAQTLTTC